MNDQDRWHRDNPELVIITRAEYERLLEAAKARPPMTAADQEEQRRSFAYGNCAIENPNVTRELVDRVADEMKPE